jgi:hypothetical protein
MTPKEKKFIGILAGITLLCGGGLYVVAGKGTSRYDMAKDQFDTLTGEIANMQKLPLFPSQQNLQAKQQELEAYKAEAQQLAAKLQAKRPKEMVNTDPQTFTNTLVKTADAALKAYAAAGLTTDDSQKGLPKGFYLGFEEYVSTPAQGNATGILGYELTAINEVHSILAAAKPKQVLNFHREKLIEEKGEAYVAPAGATYRALSFEVSFAGPESSVRDFINGLQSSKDHFFVIRSMRLTNEKQEGPKASDVEFDEKPAAGEAGAAAGGVFDPGDAFVLPDDPAPGADPAPAADPKPEEEKAPVADTSRILKQVLGAEKVQAFFRIDLLLFDAPAPASK